MVESISPELSAAIDEARSNPLEGYIMFSYLGESPNDSDWRARLERNPDFKVVQRGGYTFAYQLIGSLWQNHVEAAFGS